MDNTFKCTTCNQLFGSISARDVHVRQVHRLTYTLKLNRDDKQVLQKSPNGKFRCPISTCSSSYKLGSKIGEHYRKMHTIQPEGSSANDMFVHVDDLDANEGLCIMPDPYSTPLALSKANLYVVHHKAIVVLVCLTCHSALSNTVTKSVINHIQNHGRCKKSRQRPVHLDVSIEELSISLRGFSFTLPGDPTMLPYTKAPTRELLSPVPGIIIHQGFACRRCTYYCSAKRSMANHRLDQHNDASIGDISAPCEVQILAGGVGLKYYGVCHQDILGDNASTAENLKEIVLREFEDHCQSLQQPEQAPPVVQLAPWLRVSRWHEFAGEFMPEGIPFLEVKAQVLLPSKQDKSPFSYVGQLIFMYMNRLQTLIVKEVEYGLRRLVKQRTKGEVITTGFNPLQDEASITSYCALKTSFVLSLLRSSMEHEDVPVKYVINTDRDDLRRALGHLKMQLEQLDEDSIKDADLSIVHRVLCLLWTPDLPETLQAQKSGNCIFLRFLILHSMEKVGDDPTCEGFAFRDVRHLTKPMAILKYWGRGILLMELAQEIWHPNPRGLTKEDVDHLLQYFKDEALQTPFNIVCQAMRLATTITRGTPTIPKLVPMDDTHTTCQIDGDDMTLSRFRSMVHSIICEAHAVMEQRILLGLSTKWVERLLGSGAKIHDNMNSGCAFYSFIKDPKNRAFEEHHKDLLLHMFYGRVMSAHFISGRTDHDKIVWNKKALRNWMADCCRLQELLTLLLHFTTGLPPRGEEYKSLLLRNTTTGERSFFWYNNTLMTFQSYHKGANSGAPVKLIARFLPLKLRELFLTYLCLVRPVQCFIARMLWESKVANMYQDCWFVSMDKILKGKDLSNSIRNAFEKHCGVSWGLLDYRYLAAFFSENIREQHKHILQDPVDEAGGHTTETVGHHYAQSEKDLRDIDGHHMRAFELITYQWQRLVDVLTSTGVVDESHASSVVTLQHEDFELEIRHPAKKRRRVVYCPGFANEASSSMEVDPMTCISNDASMQAYVALTKLGHKKWRSSEQGIATALSIENIMDFVAVLPTGSGKSTVFMAPSTLVDAKTVIVVVPLQLLVSSHIHECEKARISCAIYEDNKVEVGRAPAILFVSVEIAATSPLFIILAKQLRAANKLHSIVFDEVHLLLSDFRPVMKSLLPLLAVDTQVIGLTASLPPKKQAEIETRLATEMIWLRCPTVRPNIEYRIVEAENIDEEIVTKLQTWVGSALLEDRALVYCMTRNEVEKMAKKLQMEKILCTFMHAGLDKDNKAKALECWESNTNARKVLVATGVIGCGYNYKSVRLVIHVGSFNSLEAFHQESGRAGRDGLVAESYVVSNRAYRDRAIAMHHNLELSHKWIENRSRCRRFGLHDEIDGKSQLCYLIPDAVPCDICSKKAVDLLAIGTPVAMEIEVGPVMQSHGPWTHATRSSTNQQGSTTMTPESMITVTTQQEKCPNQSCNIGAHFSNTLFARVRPTLANQKMQADFSELRIVRKFAGDGSKCLLCIDLVANQHDILKCRKIFSRCIKCLGKHLGQQCTNQLPRTHDACFKCHFQRKTSLGCHPGGYGRECEDSSGERLRLFIWQAWRQVDLKSEFCKTFPELRSKRDEEFAAWIMIISAGNTLNNFVRFAAAIVRLRFLEMG